jgi:hypothetical protein
MSTIVKVGKTFVTESLEFIHANGEESLSFNLNVVNRIFLKGITAV